MAKNKKTPEAICSEFYAELGDRLVNRNRPLPSNTRICRDFRVAVPLFCGTATSRVYRNIDPIEAELSREDLLENEDALKLKGVGWIDIMEDLVGDYFTLVKDSGRLPPDGTLGGIQTEETWSAWMHEHHFGFGAFLLPDVFSVVCCNRLLGESEKTVGGVFDRIIMAGGFPCGSESGVFRLKDIYDVPSLVVFWPWDEDPTYD